MAHKIELAKFHIDSIVSFLSVHSKLSQGHMVDYFTHNLYANCIPTKIQEEISILGFDTTLDLLLNNFMNAKHKTVPKDYQHIQKYVNEAKSYSLYNLQDICLSKSDFYEQFDFKHENSLKLDVFMKSKKSHEVETLSNVAWNISTKVNTSHLIDIGDGKGYLSSMIAFHYKIPILGVDGALINTESAIKRANKLEKHWEHVTIGGKSKGRNSETPDKSFNDRILLYKQITQLVTEQTDFDEIIQNVFLESPSGIGLIGLHTCGNLAATSLRIFNENSNIKSIVNVACCYHLLNENYLANSAMGNISTQKHGHPMSLHLQKLGFSLPRAARMLSAHSLDRILHNNDLPSIVIFYRALLEIILQENQCNEKHVGKFRRLPKDFAQYARQAGNKLGITLKQTDEDLGNMYVEYETRRRELDVFYLLRSMLAPAIEALILLDRYLFLLELGHNDVYLVQLFDPVISPRCYGLVCVK